MARPRVTLVSSLGAVNLSSANEDGEYWPPIGILTLAALIRHEADIRIVDLDHLWRLSRHERATFETAAVDAACAGFPDSPPDILGFSTISGSYPLTIRLADRCS